MESYIYTYVNKETLKTYIGARCNYKGSCYDDFNIKYFSSSKDKEFRQDMADGKLEGQIILVMNGENANKKIFEIEEKLILGYWDKYGKENSYNHYARGKWSTAGMHFTGRKLTEEQRRHLSEAHKGQASWIKGKHHTEESKSKMSLSHIGKLKGIPRTDEVKAKISKARMGHIVTEETRYKLSQYKHSEESKRKMSIAAKEKLKNKENHPFYGKHHKEETREKISKTLGSPIYDDKGNFFYSQKECALFYNKSEHYVKIRLDKGIYKYANKTIS